MDMPDASQRFLKGIVYQRDHKQIWTDRFTTYSLTERKLLCRNQSRDNGVHK